MPLARRPDLACFAVGVCGYLWLACMTLFWSPAKPIYDERFYLATVPVLQEKGFTTEFLRALEGYAGPLYTFVHYFCFPLTHLRAPGVRVVNLVLLLALALVLSLLASRLNHTGRSVAALASGFAVIAAPMTWVLAGMALTEVPAMFCVASSLLLLLCASDRPEAGSGLPLAALGGLLLSLGILGRQTYLVALLPLPLLALSERRSARVWIYGVCALLPSCSVFYVWGGLLPPLVAGDEVGINVEHLLLSCAYAGCTMLIFDPRWFGVDRTRALLVIAAGVAVNLTTQTFAVVPGRTLAESLLPAGLLSGYGVAASGSLAAIGVLFLAGALKNIWERRDDPAYLYVTLAGLCIVCTTLKIVTIFSSRYPATAIPFLLLSAEYGGAHSYAKALRIALGALLGAGVLLSYYAGGGIARRL